MKRRNGKITYEENGEPILHSPAHDVQRELFHPGKETIIDTIIEACKLFGKPGRALFGSRKVIKTHTTENLLTGKKITTYEHGNMETIDHASYLELAQNLSRGIKKILNGKKKIGICLETCFEWILASHGAQFDSVTVVTAYVNLGLEGIASIINQTELDTMICDGNMISFFEKLQSECKTLKNLICVGKMEKESSILKCYQYSDLIIDGMKSKEIKLELPKPDTIAYILYTSGTTGNPKGVIHCHSNFCYGCAAMKYHLPYDQNDRYISYLPLAHIFEIMMIHSVVFNGAFVGFGNPRTLIAKEGGAKHKGDLEVIRPTALAGVPKVFLTIKKAVDAKLKLEGGSKAKLFRWVLKKRIANLRKEKPKNVWLQNVVFKKIIDMLGGNLRVIISGGSAIEKEVHEWFQAVLYNVTFVQGYGLSESLGLATSELPSNGWRTQSSVGEAMSCVKIKLRSVPEMKYDVKNLEGEIMLSGENITQGYYKNEELTKKVLIKDSKGVTWFATGDVGRFNKNGTVTIIDRIKTLSKLSNGEYISVTRLETMYETSPMIQPNGIFVYVDSTKDYPIAICLIQPSFAKSYAEKNGFKDLERMINTQKFKDEVLQSFNNIADVRKCKKFQRIKNIKCEFSEWTPENGLTSASFKLKRKAMEEHYSEVIKELYDPQEIEGYIEKSENSDEKDGEKKNFWIQVI